MSKKLSYRESGVDMDAGDRFVEAIAPLARATQGPQVLGGVGGFAALFALGAKSYQDPVLVSGTDGVGTKVLLAEALDRLDTVGIDLVAMCVNDILTTGAAPLFFLDYLAVGHLDPDRCTRLVKGIAEGCRQAACALVGGETAEMPGLYAKKEFDLAGFAVGVVEREKIINGSGVRPGQIILGLSSSGIHSNGYSLVRRALLGSSEKLPAEEIQGALSKSPKELAGETLADAVMKPTRIYRDSLFALQAAVKIHALSHITGAGLPGNAPRTIPETCAVHLDRRLWKRPAIFSYLQQVGNIDDHSMWETFNMGIGMIAVVDKSDTEKALTALSATDPDACVIGEIVPRSARDQDFAFVDP